MDQNRKTSRVKMLRSLSLPLPLSLSPFLSLSLSLSFVFVSIECCLSLFLIQKCCFKALPLRREHHSAGSTLILGHTSRGLFKLVCLGRGLHRVCFCSCRRRTLSWKYGLNGDHVLGWRLNLAPFIMAARSEPGSTPGSLPEDGL